MDKPSLLIDDVEFERFKLAYIAMTVAPYKDAQPFRAKVVTEGIEQMFANNLQPTNGFAIWCEARKLGIKEGFDKGFMLGASMVPPNIPTVTNFPKWHPSIGENVRTPDGIATCIEMPRKQHRPNDDTTQWVQYGSGTQRWYAVSNLAPSSPGIE